MKIRDQSKRSELKCIDCKRYLSAFKVLFRFVYPPSCEIYVALEIFFFCFKLLTVIRNHEYCKELTVKRRLRSK